MNTTRLIEISDALGTAFRTRADLNIRRSHAAQDLTARQLALTPPEGWPGKNAEQREVERMRVLSQDEAIEKINDVIAQADTELMQMDALIQSLEAERRALEWTIRAQMVEAIAGRGDGDDETGFDDVMQGVVDDFDPKFQAEIDAHEAESAAWQYIPQPVDDDLPF